MIPTIHIEDNGVPRYVQIRDQLLRAIGAGALRPGEQMPTMRELAVAVKVDLNTVRHAYDELEKTGAIVIVRARGTYVAERPPPLDTQLLAKRTESLAHETIAIAQAAGIDPVELANRIIGMTQPKRGKK
jgi:GntR family transcriptional regulator